MASIIDNKKKKLNEALKNALKQAERVDILTAFFYFSGYDLLAEELRDKKIRILVGNTIDPQYIGELCTAINEGLDEDLASYSVKRFEKLSNLQKKKTYIDSFVGLFNKSSLSSEFDETEQQKVFKMFLDKLADGTLEIRLTSSLNHAKAFILTNKYEYSCFGDQKGIVFTGSSNFTYNGLLGQGEMNERFSDNDKYDEYSSEFESLWMDSKTIDIAVSGGNDFKFVIANSLIKLEGSTGSYQMSLFEDQEHIKKLQEVRELYFRVEDADEKKDLKDEFKDIQQSMLLTTISNYDKQASKLYQSLSEWKPFSNEPTAWFDPEWMFGIKNGFDVVIGNPPYIQLQKSIDATHKTKVGDMYEKCGYDTFAKTGDIYCLFYEKGLNLLKDNGILTYITSNKWMRAGYGKNLRRFLSKHNPVNLIDFAGQKVFESATVDVNILLCQKSKNQGKTLACTANNLCKNNLSVFKSKSNYNFLWIPLKSLNK